MATKARVRARRRDRRKAKASGWRREGKQMGCHVGHGTSGGVTKTVTTRGNMSQPQREAITNGGERW